MIPKIDFNTKITSYIQPSNTYKMEIKKERVIGYNDGIEAIKQCIFKILNTERYIYHIYTHNYGVELLDLIGEPIEYVCPELQRRITEALVVDNRITDVHSFDFKIPKKNIVHVEFTVETILGDVRMYKEVHF